MSKSVLVAYGSIERKIPSEHAGSAARNDKCIQYVRVYPSKACCTLTCVSLLLLPCGLSISWGLLSLVSPRTSLQAMSLCIAGLNV